MIEAILFLIGIFFFIICVVFTILLQARQAEKTLDRLKTNIDNFIKANSQLKSEIKILTDSLEKLTKEIV